MLTLGQCRNCWESCHGHSKCPHPQKPSAPCFLCGMVGHNEAKCAISAVARNGPLPRPPLRPEVERRREALPSPPPFKAQRVWDYSYLPPPPPPPASTSMVPVPASPPPLGTITLTPADKLDVAIQTDAAEESAGPHRGAEVGIQTEISEQAEPPQEPASAPSGSMQRVVTHSWIWSILPEEPVTLKSFLILLPCCALPPQEAAGLVLLCGQYRIGTKAKV